ncbi:spermatogenesis-associated protein 7 homolog [Homalodisca vitripennis]|uniref:spermatogenesis-associated protein 7 homolog n=1 Tax=Homalodisca vitripennis TaxID=197043 RepID=UPI001EEC5766|nr:spermatogenesis-associated protein 7 homolog [Homalodisca vitripennis]
MKSSKVSGKRINNFEVYPKNAVAKTIMYQNMSSHYRRIYSAKSRIDTGPPFSHKPKPIQWNKKQKEYTMLKPSQSSVTLTPSSKSCSRQGCGDRASPSFQPQISQSSAESKLRTLRVYHPPRKRIYSTLPASTELKSDPEVSVPEIPWIRTTEEVKTTVSKGSSSDSAYTEEGEGNWSGGESRGPTPVSDTRIISRSEDLLYVKFIGGITEEVLRKGIFTNKALKSIFQSHIDAHKQYLNLRRMQEEVEKLQLELGIPKDDSPDFVSSYESISTTESISKISSSKVEDKELMEALRQLNLSPSLKADVAKSLGLYSPLDILSNSNSTESLKVRTHSKRTTFSSPLEVIHDVSHKAEKLPLSDDDSYEILSEGSESRPLTPLGLSW